MTLPVVINWCCRRPGRPRGHVPLGRWGGLLGRAGRDDHLRGVVRLTLARQRLVTALENLETISALLNIVVVSSIHAYGLKVI